MAKKQSKVVDSNSLMINEEVLRDKIYSIRGQKVMLDYDLAKIYGYTTKAFNQQVKNNAEKFDGDDFMFKLTRSEINNLVKYSSYALSDSDESVRSKKLTSRDGLFTGQDGGARYLPHAFTEQGIYMLMTVLRGELAVKQSRALIRMFKAMKDYIIENQELSKYKNNLAIMERVIDDSRSIEEIRGEIKFIRTEGKVHDRFIVLDYGTGYERVYYFGASEKDAGGKISVMSRLDDGEVRDILLKELGELRKNRELVLQ